MALDQIWKQQLTLVTYGNEYLSQDLSFSRWRAHPIFNQHMFWFRDLNSQHLLAQHFEIWLEGLKRQGTTRLSLHNASLLVDEKNPNANVELLPYPHFIVSHEAHKKFAWICGKELPEWYNADNDYEFPPAQRIELRQETFWRYELNSKLAKKVEADLEPAHWDEIHLFTEQELFSHTLAADFQPPEQQNLPYYGIPLTTDTPDPHQLSLLPSHYQANYAHRMLYRLEALKDDIQQKIQHPYNADNEVLSPEEQLDLRHFAQKLDDLSAKFIVKVANHYQSAQLTPAAQPNPLEPFASDSKTTHAQAAHSAKAPSHHKVGATGVIKLILITVVICLLAYYFGL
ncbi:hypothetical protein [Acinetobacter indicus]|uniref:hypothetical protein n=1 Tax=Acinetobacter indicus TaxID=756892 RepID=UPI001362C975|nr:hypothetical protein [Acinetobacter indicus]